MMEKSNVPYDTISRTSVSSQTLFNKCCCCIPLRTGCFILGYLNLVVNCLQTLALVAVTAFVGAVTHGFDHFDHFEPNEGNSTEVFFEARDSVSAAELEKMEQPLLTQLGFILMVLLIANVSWMIINIACLVGLHKRNPGPIRVYVGFATARLVLSFAAFIYLVMSNRAQGHNVITHCIDLALTGYFILVYYIYAVRLEKERAAESAQPPVCLYPSTIDKSHLVLA